MLGIKFSAMKQQRRSAFAVAAAFYLTDKNHVVAFNVSAAVETFKAGCRTLEQGRTCGTFSKGNALPAVGLLAGKTLGQLFLVSGQNVDGVM